jgi:hypothetical protein
MSRSPTTSKLRDHMVDYDPVYIKVGLALLFFEVSRGRKTKDLALAPGTPSLPSRKQSLRLTTTFYLIYV